MARKNAGIELGSTEDFLRKLLMLELFKLGLQQGNIAKKLRMSKADVNAFLKGMKRNDSDG